MLLIRTDPNDGAKGVFANNNSYEPFLKLALGVFAYNASSGASNNPEDAVADAIGGKVAAYQGKKIVLPRGVDDSATFNPDISDAIAVQAKAIGSMKGVFYAGGVAMTAQELAEKLPKLSLQTRNINDDGSVTYSLIYNGQEIRGPDGKRYLFDVSKDMIPGKRQRLLDFATEAAPEWFKGSDDSLHGY